MRLITWNVNSVRLRLDGLSRLVSETGVDVVCLQEIKADKTKFPFEAIRNIGFPYIEMEGIPGYHGVATLSRIPMERMEGRDWCGKQDGRYIGVKLDGGLSVHNFYVPAGGDEPDAEVNSKFQHKLDFLDEMAIWGQSQTHADAVLVGDLNVAPLPNDVWSHKALLKVVSHTPIEVDALQKAQTLGRWTDLVRLKISEDTPLFSWWSYRSKDWLQANRGRRLDHIWGLGAAVETLSAVSVIKEARGWEKPSDHAPVMVDFND